MDSPRTFVSQAEGRFLLELARRTLTSVVSHAASPSINPEELGAALRRPRACFVTLTDSGSLRGCIGHVFPRVPLYQAVIEGVEKAALQDPRFPPTQPSEVFKLKIEISVLSDPQPLLFASPEDLISQLQPHTHGVVLQIRGRTATFLPQVWRHIPEKVEFLDRLAMKAGCSPSAWRDKDAAATVYYVQSFEETQNQEAQN
jgi:AmmeMemoRadiSam system protein A